MCKISVREEAVFSPSSSSMWRPPHWEENALTQLLLMPSLDLFRRKTLPLLQTNVEGQEGAPLMKNPCRGNRFPPGAGGGSHTPTAPCTLAGPAPSAAPATSPQGKDTHRALAFFSENTLRQKSPSWKGSKVAGTTTYSPGGSRTRAETSRRLT